MATILKLPLPCPLNGLYTPVIPNGKRYAATALSQQGTKKWHELVKSIRDQIGYDIEPYTGPVAIIAHVYPRDRRLPDIDAYMKQLFDCLQVESKGKNKKRGAGVIEDDTQVKGLVVVMHEPHHPGRIELHIHNLVDEEWVACEACVYDALDDLCKLWVTHEPQIEQEEVDPLYEPNF